MEGALQKIQTVNTSKEMVDTGGEQERENETLLFSVRCSQKNVIRAYYILCDECGQKDNLCCKCGQSQETPIE